MSSGNIQGSLSKYLERLSSLEEEVQVLSAEKASKVMEVGALQSVVNTLGNQVRYMKQKMKTEEEGLKLSWVETEERKLEESLERRLEKEKNVAVIESARSEQSMLREAVRNLKIEKIRLLKKMEAFSDKRNVTEAARERVTGLDEVTNKFVLAQEMDDKLRQELEQLISVAVEYQEKLNIAAKQIELDVKKKGKLEMVLMKTGKIESVDVEVTETEPWPRDENMDEMVDIKEENKIDNVKEKIRGVEKEIEEKSIALEEILSTVGSLVLADKEKITMEEEKRKKVEQLKEEIVLEKRRVDVEREEYIAKFMEEKNHLETRELAVNISLANLNMDIERERTRRTRMEENVMVGVEDLEDDMMFGDKDQDQIDGNPVLVQPENEQMDEVSPQ